MFVALEITLGDHPRVLCLLVFVTGTFADEPRLPRPPSSHHTPPTPPPQSSKGSIARPPPYASRHAYSRTDAKALFSQLTLTLRTLIGAVFSGRTHRRAWLLQIGALRYRHFSVRARNSLSSDPNQPFLGFVFGAPALFVFWVLAFCGHHAPAWLPRALPV